jgi:hypothetical protein
MYFVPGENFAFFVKISASKMISYFFVKCQELWSNLFNFREMGYGLLTLQKKIAVFIKTVKFQMFLMEFH